ncbi:tryptophan--tRNA ligase [Candidatus Babeliales bacterium]|nr:tryptophan--tRNA ligase [Candidatus Babeliales bacterium]
MRVLSGIQSSGMVHLGNYFGALMNWVKLQNEGHDCFYFIANLHSMTQSYDPALLKKRTLELTATLIAIGIDPEKSTLFIQSDVSEHSELAWILSCLAPLGEMERMIQFKEKSAQSPESVNAALLLYPVLQSADILLYRPDLVPVGIDQAQHLELTRNLVRKFNKRFNTEYFKEPQTFHTETVKVVGLDGTAKMSKSRDNFIGLVEEPEIIKKKLRTAATDPARVRRDDPGNPDICNVFSLHKLISSAKDQAWSEKGCRTAEIGCLDCKGRLFENLMQLLDPIRERYKELMEKPGLLHEYLDLGAQKAKKEAQKTLEKVHELIGISR